MSYLAASAAFSLLFAFADLLALVVAAACLVSFFSLGGWAALYAYTPSPTRSGCAPRAWAGPAP